MLEGSFSLQFQAYHGKGKNEVATGYLDIFPPSRLPEMCVMSCAVLKLLLPRLGSLRVGSCYQSSSGPSQCFNTPNPHQHPAPLRRRTTSINNYPQYHLRPSGMRHHQART